MGVKYNKNDLIRREDARRIIDSPRSKEQMLIMLEDTPAGNVEERKKGKWVESNPQNSDTCRLIRCSECGNGFIVGFNVPYEDWIEDRNFCFRCGADMREDDNKKAR